MARIEVFADITCPFTHVGLRRLNEARQARGSQPSLRVRGWPLEWINGAPLGADLLAREVDALRTQVAPDLFAGFDAAMFPLTSIPAFGLAAAAYLLDDAIGETVSLALRDALFEHGEDISDHDVLAAIGRNAGVEPFDRTEAESALQVDWEQGKARGVRGSPHFFVGGRSWFCPSLNISHDHERFDIQTGGEKMRDFYAAAVG